MYMENLDSMFVHLAVPAASPSAFPSRPTSTFSDFYVATQRETRKVWVSFHAEYSVFRLDLREK